jgi:hypothetical protein
VLVNEVPFNLGVIVTSPVVVDAVNVAV